MYPIPITSFLTIMKKMKYPFKSILTDLNACPLAATTFQIVRIYSYPQYAQRWEWDPILRLKRLSPPCKVNGGFSRF